MNRKEAKEIVNELCMELMDREPEGSGKSIGRCNRCGTVVTDDISTPDYSAYCPWHDEDLFEMEFTRYSDMFDPERDAQVFVEFMVNLLESDGSIDEDEEDISAVREILEEEYNDAVLKARERLKESHRPEPLKDFRGKTPKTNFDLGGDGFSNCEDDLFAEGDAEQILVQFPGSDQPIKMKLTPGDRVWASNESQEDAIKKDEYYRFEGGRQGDLYLAKHSVTSEIKAFKYVVPAINLSYINRETREFVEIRANINEYGDPYERYNKTGGYRYYQCPICKPDNHHYQNLRVSDAMTDVHFLEYAWRNGHTSKISCRDGDGNMCDYIRFLKEK